MFLLNVYYRDVTFPQGKDSNSKRIELGSKLFSVEVHNFVDIPTYGKPAKTETFDSCVYFINATDKCIAKTQQAMQEVDKEVRTIILQNIKNRLEQIAATGTALTPEVSEKIVKEENNKFFEIMPQVTRGKGKSHIDLFLNIEYEAVLNKNQI